MSVRFCFEQSLSSSQPFLSPKEKESKENKVTSRRGKKKEWRREHFRRIDNASINLRDEYEFSPLGKVPLYQIQLAIIYLFKLV